MRKGILENSRRVPRGMGWTEVVTIPLILIMLTLVLLYFIDRTRL